MPLVIAMVSEVTHTFGNQKLHWHISWPSEHPDCSIWHHLWLESTKEDWLGRKYSMFPGRMIMVHLMVLSYEISALFTKRFESSILALWDATCGLYGFLVLSDPWHILKELQVKAFVCLCVCGQGKNSRRFRCHKVNSFAWHCCCLPFLLISRWWVGKQSVTALQPSDKVVSGFRWDAEKTVNAL